MEFNALVSDRLDLIFQKHNLHVIEQFKNYVKFRSDNIILTISHNDRENSNSLFIGRNESALYPIDDNVLKDVFNSVLKINYVTPEVFVNNLAVFFEEEGKQLISGNADTLNAVEKYIYAKSEEYTLQLMEQQNLDAANKAWEE